MSSNKEEIEKEVGEGPTDNEKLVSMKMDAMNNYDSQIDEDHVLNSDARAELDKFIGKKGIEESLRADLEKAREILFTNNDIHIKKILFVYAILKSELSLSEILFTSFKAKLQDVIFEKDFKYSEDIKELYKHNYAFIEIIMKGEILELTKFGTLEESLIDMVVKAKSFKFLIKLLKKTRDLMAEETKKAMTFRSMKYSHAQTFREIIVTHLSMRSNQGSLNYDNETLRKWDSANDNLTICIKAREQKACIKLMKFYYIKYNKDFVAAEVLHNAILHNFYLFVKIYYDIWPLSQFRIFDLDVISHAMQLIDERETFIHGVFLISKIHIHALTEIHIRLMIDKFDKIYKDKLFYFTYTLNPILLAVYICQMLRTLGIIFSNIRIRLNLTSENYLKLASLIRDNIHDELFIKSLYLRKFYPSGKSLLLILYTDRKFYTPLLASPLVTEIVNDLWNCDYKYTLNFAITSTSFKNLKGPIYYRDNLNSEYAVPSMSSIGTNDSTKGPEPPARQNNPSIMNQLPKKLPANLSNINPIAMFDPQSLEMDAYKRNLLTSINKKNPFQFVMKSSFFDHRMFNHIFSYFFWQKSPAYKVFVEAFIYMVCFIVIIINAFEVFRLRRVFEDFADEFMLIVDGLIGLKYGYPLPLAVQQIFGKYMYVNGITDVNILLYKLSQMEYCDIMNLFVPKEKERCYVYFDAAANIWGLADRFVFFQFFFYLCFLGSVFELIYVQLQQKKFVITFKLINDSIMLAANVVIQYIYFGSIQGKVLPLRQNLFDRLRDLENYMMIFLFFMWIKFFIYLKLTSKFGYIIKVIEIMIKDLFNFLVLFMILILASALLVYDLLDSSNDYFSSFEITIRSLFLFTYGQVYYNTFTGNAELGSFLLVVFSVLSIILCINILLAILNTTYEKINQVSQVENTNILYENYLEKKPNKFYSALISIAPPLNLYVLLFTPFLIIKRSQRLNKFVCVIGYVIYLAVYLSLFIGVNLGLLIPLCYLKYVVSILLNVSLKQKTSLSWGLFLLWLFFGWGYLLYVFIVNDIRVFLKSCFFTSLNKETLDEISQEEINIIIKAAKKFISEEKKAEITLGEFQDEIRGDLEKYNKEVRRQSMMFDPSFKNGYGMDSGRISKKALTRKIFNQFIPSKAAPATDNSNNTPVANAAGNNNMKKNFEKRLLQDVEIDKMEVFSLVKQYVGIDGLIKLPRMVELLDMVKYCKKFNLMKLNRKKKEKLVNCVQVVNMLAFEKAVIAILSENTKTQDQLNLVMESLMGKPAAVEEKK